jgi:hypothetical protein
MLTAITIGTLGGALLAFVVSKWLLAAMATAVSSHPETRKTIRVSGAVFGAIALAPAVFLAVMGGGRIGAQVSGTLAETLGLSDGAVPLLLASQIMLVTAITVAVNAAVGGWLGMLFARNLYRGHA